MAAKARHKRRSYAGRPAAGRFARHMRDWAEEFGQSMEDLGERIEERFDEGFGFERNGRRPKARVFGSPFYCNCGEQCHCRHSFGSFSVLSPLFKSLFGTAMLAIFAWLLSFLDLGAKGGFFPSVSAFFLSNIALFFAVALFFEYAKYAIHLLPRFLRFTRPFVDAAGAVWAAWIIMSLIGIVNIYWPHVAFIQIVMFIQSGYGAIFLLFLVLGFIALPLRRNCGCGCDCGCDCCGRWWFNGKE